MANHEQTTEHQHFEGQILVMAAVASAILIAFAALAVDAGLAMAERRGAQNAADAASMAVARAMVDSASMQELEETAEHYGELNGYQVTLDNVAIDEQERTVEVTVHVEVPRIFLGAFYDGDWSVSTSAEASLSAVQEPYALIALGEDPNCHPSTGIRFSGTVGANILDGSIGSNACIRTDGNSGEIFVDGNVEALHGINDSHNNITVPSGNSIRTRSTPIEDPFAHWVEPTCSANGTVVDDPHDDDGVILSPGTHSDFSDKGNPDLVNLLPGVYCIDDRVTVGSQMVVRSVDADYPTTGQVGAGGGVLLVMQGNKGELRFNGQGSLQVRSIAYLNPAFAGCTNACEEEAVIWVSQSSCRDMDATGGSSSTIRGVVYAPCSDISIGGNPSTNVLEGMIVAETIGIHGNAALNLVANQDPIEATPEIYLTR